MQTSMKKILALTLLFAIALCALAQRSSFVIKRNSDIRISLLGAVTPVEKSALAMLSNDLRNVFDGAISSVPADGDIVAGTIGQGVEKFCNDDEARYLHEHEEGFVMRVLPSGKLLIAGSDGHGTAYALLELSRLAGVSPWEWWADAVPAKREEFSLPSGYNLRQAPSVAYRGIFINDEDWGLMPWSSKTMEPGNKLGVIGPRTTEKIFQLLLRLRANTYWPPMHECTYPFFLTPGNREVAKQYGIYIGSSHCEPMASSTAGEWPRRGKGDYNYLTNKAGVEQFWTDRLKDVSGQEIIYTLGMRGLHDGAMQGAKTVAEQKAVLTDVVRDQREMLAEYVNRDLSKVPQVFIPYKEVLDVYNAGLKVPDDVTLMWCDDNYGYIRHFPTAEERARKGGNGVYYHVSYWGRPHDYLWLGTPSPYLVYQQMDEAYRRGIRRMWILNVGDIKPAEYQIELFMDMAWNIDAVRKSGVAAHLENFLAREFGKKAGEKLLPIMNEHYRLAFIRKPEFLGNTRCEEYGPGSEKWYVVSDPPWTDDYIKHRLEDYSQLSDAVEKIGESIPGNRRDTYFQLVKYPVQAATQMNDKLLYAQLARHGKDTWKRCDEAYDSIRALTAIYNHGIDNGGKWNGIMDYQPRKQPVFDSLKRTVPKATPSFAENIKAITIPAAHYAEGNPAILRGLGYSSEAIEIRKGTRVVYAFRQSFATDSLRITLKFLPNHPVVPDEGLKVKVSIDGGEPVVVDYSTQGRSEEWKENVLRNQALRCISVPDNRMKRHHITVEALSEGIILDQIEIDRPGA